MTELKNGLSDYIKILEEKENNRLEEIRLKEEKETEIRRLKDKLHDEKIRLKQIAEQQERDERERQEAIDRERKAREEEQNKLYYKNRQIELLTDEYRKELIYIRDKHAHDPYFSKKVLEQKRKETLDNIQVLNNGALDLMNLAQIKYMENKILSKNIKQTK